jgi:hypothetical protein
MPCAVHGFIPTEFYIVLEPIPSITTDDIDTIELISSHETVIPIYEDDIEYLSTVVDKITIRININEGLNSYFSTDGGSIVDGQVFVNSSYMLKITLMDGKVGYTNFIFSTETGQ